MLVDSFTVTSSTGNLRGCCIAISKYIGFLRDMTWNTNDRLMILCADSANPINLRGVLTGDSLISCANRRLLCEATFHWRNYKSTEAYVFVFCVNGFTHTNVLLEIASCFALVNMEL